MNNFSKLIVFIVICLAIWWGYDKFTGGNVKIPDFTDKENTQIIDNNPVEEIKNENTEIKQKTEEKDDTYIYVYMLTTDKSGGQFLKPVKRPLAPGKDRLTQAITMLLSGPNNIEISDGIYSEVPDAARLISITTTDDKVIINLSSSFAVGGGSDSTYSRM
ncbi:GerMN domain-containing protein, partial [bacterium]|nr:GerMN domain-containing protein [bacterium]